MRPSGTLGGKIELCIPRERLPHQILRKNFEVAELGVKVHLNTPIDRAKFDEIYKDHEIVIIAVVRRRARDRIPGSEHIMTAYDFLKRRTGQGP